MTEEILSRKRILVAAEDVLRRYGPAKATVVDVAKALGVSHGSVYRHFTSKAELRDAVLEMWFKKVTDPLEEIVGKQGDSCEKIHRWLRALHEIKVQKKLGDPELFETYCLLVADSREVVADHMVELTKMVSRMVQQGIDRNEIISSDPEATARGILGAMSLFLNPANSMYWGTPQIDQNFAEVWQIVSKGLQNNKK